MFLKHKHTGVLVEVLTISDLYDPCMTTLMAQAHAGEEMQDPIAYAKAELMFPSGEPLPLCWLDVHYQDRVTQHPTERERLVVS
jgi:hypothetical protein